MVRTASGLVPHGVRACARPVPHGVRACAGARPGSGCLERGRAHGQGARACAQPVRLQLERGCQGVHGLGGRAHGPRVRGRALPGSARPGSQGVCTGSEGVRSAQEQGRAHDPRVRARARPVSEGVRTAREPQQGRAVLDRGCAHGQGAAARACARPGRKVCAQPRIEDAFTARERGSAHDPVAGRPWRQVNGLDARVCTCMARERGCAARPGSERCTGAL